MHVKRSGPQNKRLAISQMAFQARKVFGTFEKRVTERLSGLSRNGPQALVVGRMDSAIHWITQLVLLVFIPFSTLTKQIEV